MRFIKDVKKYYKYAIYATKAKLKSEVANSYLNWVWWILEPFCSMLIYTLVFGVILQMSEAYFPIFIFSGNAMWIFFSNTLNKSVKLVKMNQVVLSKVYVPKFILLLIEMLVSAYKMLLSFGIVFGMLLIFRMQITWRIVLIIPIFIVLFLFTFGIGMICVHLGVYIEDLSYIVTIGLSMLMYLTGVFYSIENRLPSPYGNILVGGNPVACLISNMRKVVIYAATPNYVQIAIWFLISIIIDIWGIRLVYKNENSYIKVI